MSDNLSVPQFGTDETSTSSCPECGGAGKPSWHKGINDHVSTPDDCHTYSWSSNSAFVAKDIHSHGERKRRADAIDARISKMNPFRRKG